MAKIPANDGEGANTVCLPPEVEEGNVEYKLKLVNPTKLRFIHLVTQMKWRLKEGGGEAIYEVGVEDNGNFAGLGEEEMKASLETINKMAEELGATTAILRKRLIVTPNGHPSHVACQVLVRKIPDDQQFIDLRIAVLGNSHVGKSTLLGVLTQGELDNGQGRARLNLFRHLHEIETGRTSSISLEIMGFDHKGQVIASRAAEEICENAAKLITFIDLAGHQKYLKTTIFGLTGHAPDFAMLVVSSSSGIAGTTREHLGLALALEVPIIVVVNKTDLCPEATVEHVISQLRDLLTYPGCNKVPMRVTTEDQAVTAAMQQTNSICPIFSVSCVNGKNLDLLKKFFNVLQPLQNAKEQEKLIQKPPEFQVDEQFAVPEVGTVVSGILCRGTIKEGEELLLGPCGSGQFKAVTVGTIHRNRTPCRVARAGQACTLALRQVERSLLRKGMVLVGKEVEIVCCQEFEAEIFLLFHMTSITKKFQCTIHIGSICQTAIILDMNKPSIQTNDHANVKFRFIKHPEFLNKSMRLLFHEGRTKGIGQVTKTFAYSEPDR